MFYVVHVWHLAQIKDDIVSNIDEIADAIDFNSEEDPPKHDSSTGGVADAIRRNVLGVNDVLNLVT